MAGNNKSKLAFVPEFAGRPAIAALIQRSREIASSNDVYENARLSLEISLDHRADIINRFGIQNFEVSLEDLETTAPLPDWLLAFRPQE